MEKQSREFDGTLDQSERAATHPEEFDRGEPSQLCARCGKPGAMASLYKGEHLHMACKLEAKLDAGELVKTDSPTQPRLRGTGVRRKRTGSARFKRTFGGPRT